MKYVEWVEPADASCQAAVTQRIPVEEAIRWQRAAGAANSHMYGSDESALDDFVVCHWACIIDVLKPAFEWGSCWIMNSPWMMRLNSGPQVPPAWQTCASSRWVLSPSTGLSLHQKSGIPN